MNTLSYIYIYSYMTVEIIEPVNDQREIEKGIGKRVREIEEGKDKLEMSFNK